ncbi:MAG: sugar ABC transporter permease [Chloroflexota bacterium]
MNSSSKYTSRHWQILPYLLPLLVFLALAAIVNASQQRVLATAEELSFEDISILNWWQVNQRENLNTLAGMLAARITADSSLDQLAQEVGMAEFNGYVAWVDGTIAVRSELNGEAKIGAPEANKLFQFAPAVGYPSADFWQEEGQVFWMSMAPVHPDKGGGNVIIQQPIDEAVVADLANLTGRDIIFYDYAEKTPLLSSDPALLSDPPRISRGWMEEVASGQLPKTTTSNNSQGAQIVGMTGFPDFAGISYSGYVGLVEESSLVNQLVPQRLYWILALIATLIMGIGAWLLHRMTGAYLDNRGNTEHATRRAIKLRMILITLLFFLPALVVAGYMMIQTSNQAMTLDMRTADVAKEILIPGITAQTSHIAGFAEGGTALTLGEGLSEELTKEGLAAALRQAHGLEFAVIDANGELTQAGNEALSPEMLASLAQVEPGTTQVVQSGRTVMLAARQLGPDGTTAVGGVRLNKSLPNVEDISGVDVTLLNGTESWVTTLAELEINSLNFDDGVLAELGEEGESTFLQTVGWNPGKVTISQLPLADSDEWQLVVSQASTVWSNAMRTLQGFGLASVGLAAVLGSIVLLTLLNLDQPLLLRRMYTGYLFILPAVIWLVWWQLGPALFAAYLSFHKWSVLSPAKPFVGLHNYRQIWGDDVFWGAMWNTVIYVTQIPLGIALALALALALNRPLKGIRYLRTIYYMPAVTSVVVVSLMWKLLYNKDFGIFNYLFDFVGLGPYGFLQSTAMAMPSIMGMAVWLGLGARMLLFLAGLQSIPNDFYEAADVDGAGRWNKFRHITIPLLAPTTFFVFITSIIGSFQVFGPIYVLTQGGPAGATDVAVHRIYFEAWQNLRFGYASAETVILFAILFIVTVIQFRYFGRNVSYG